MSPFLGVGESTNISVRYFHRLMGVEERPLMRAANDTFKIAIRFEGFSRPGASFFHPFGKPVSAAAGWLKPDAQSHSRRSSSLATAVCSRRSARILTSSTPDSMGSF